MTSSENLASIEPWAFRSAFAADSWLSEAFVRDAETLTKALQKSLSNTTSPADSVPDTLATAPSDFITPFMNNPPETPNISNVTTSEPDTLPKRHRPSLPNSGKITKRKSRASKKTQTTFITADPANFRQMVQQVTGVRFGSAQVAVPSVLKPEPQRPGSRMAGIGCGYLPTLDTSAFLLDHHQQMGSSSGEGAGAGAGAGSGQFEFHPGLVGEGGSGAGIDFDALSTFPTLESWKVM